MAGLSSLRQALNDLNDIETNFYEGITFSSNEYFTKFK